MGGDPHTATANRHQFASDNYSGACPEAWQAMAEANRGHASAYGDDDWTARASELLRDLFEIDCEVFFVFNGTSANALALASLCQSYHGIICHELAHVETDECGAPEFFSNGTKVLLAPGEAGRIRPEAVHQLVTKRSDIHFPKPRVLSLTQATEVGTVYSLGQLEALQEMARRHNLRIHMDGARFSNAVAALDTAPKNLTWKAGVDVLCFGGTKIGMAFGEAVVFFKRDLAHEFAFRCKQAGQLASKMRFLAAQWVGMLESGAWLRNATQANRCASLLESRLSQIPGLEILWKCEANSVFVQMPEPLRIALHAKGWKFYTFIGGGARLMCSWDTTEADVDALVNDILELNRS